MTTRALLLTALLAMQLGCQTTVESEDDPIVDWSLFPLLVPIGSQVTVKVGGNYFFESQNPMDGEEPLGSCSISLGVDDLAELGVIESPILELGPISETVLANFQAALPRQSSDFFSMQIQGDFVSWGLSDKDLGEEWSNRPGGELKGDCIQSGEPIVLCNILWTGEATDDCTSTENCMEPEVREATVEMSCVFGPVLGCELFCGDDNSCTLNYCDAAGVCGKTNIPEGRICEDERGMEGRCTADAQCVALPPDTQQ